MQEQPLKYAAGIATSGASSTCALQPEFTIVNTLGDSCSDTACSSGTAYASYIASRSAIGQSRIKRSSQSTRSCR